MRYEVRYMAHISLWSCVVSADIGAHRRPVVDTVEGVGVRGFATRWRSV